MLVDASHRRWILATAALALLALSTYAVLRAKAGTWDAGGAAGLAFAAGAAGILVFEALLALRKSRPALRLGRASGWGRAHVWLGCLALVFSLVHAGFRVRGTMSLAVVVVLALVSASGLVGLALQQVLPRWMTARLPRETVYEQIPQLLGDLRTEAEELVQRVNDDVMSRFYREDIAPFLVGDPRGHRLLDGERAARVFEQVGKRVPVACQDAVADLRDLCAERAQLFLQERMQRWLHGWLLVHVPLAYALLILVAAHAVMTLRY